MSMRLSPDDARALDDVAKRAPTIPRLTIARMALRLGLIALRANPARLLEAPTPAVKPTRRVR